jgi:membrane-bound ClpP family serine protease
MFVVVGVIGAVLIITFLVFDDVLDGVLPDADWISGPVIGAFLAAFGVAGWAVSDGFDAPGWLSALVGIAAGIGLGYVAFRVTKALVHTATDATPTAASLVGREGRVVTGALPGQLGEVLVPIGGQQVKLAAICEDELSRGARVVVVDVASPTKVVVQPADRFWATGTSAPSS